MPNNGSFEVPPFSSRASDNSRAQSAARGGLAAGARGSRPRARLAARDEELGALAVGEGAGKSDIDEALAGLASQPKRLPAKLLYDAIGCRLFYAIAALPEYYLTRTEMALLATIGRGLVPTGLSHASLVEFGGSDEAKARYLLDMRDACGQPVFAAYAPIDVAAQALAEMRGRLAQAYPRLKVFPVVGDFTQPLRLPFLQGSRLGFFPGSTIGNLDPDAATRFLASARSALGPGSWFLLGADLRKSPEVLLPAYNDSAGVTAAFNLNLLRRLNREAGADFDSRLFRHEAIWNGALSRIEMHLVSRRAQRARVAGQAFDFAEGESIHTENSYKLSPPAIAALASAAGWRPAQAWTDENKMFGIFLLADATTKTI